MGTRVVRTRGWFGVALTGMLLLSGVVVSVAQISPITSSGLNTQVSAPIHLPGEMVQHNITGGNRPGGGGNLFHSFGEFGVPTNNIANFLNDAALPTTNILSRVTGGNPSNIFGTISTEGFGNANLFLMNPAGIVFGPNAFLNVGGSSHFSSFVDSKAESLSPTPGAFLASPLLQPAASVHAVADRSAGQRAPVILKASLAPLVLGHAVPTTACP